MAKANEKKSNEKASSGVTTGDVKVAIPSNVQSIITQVSRDDPVIRPSQVQIRGPKPPQKRSFFARLLCCAPKAVSQQTSNPVSYPSSSVTKQSSTAINNSAKSIEVTPTLRSSSGKKCLALDLDETLVHSSFQPVDNASFVISVVIEDLVHNVFVIKRPGVDEFIERLAPYYELVVYTASLSKYADPLLDLLDPKKLISKRLFRENCVFYDGHYVKDLTVLNRDISQTIIVDNSPMSYIFQPENAIDCTSFFDDPADVELWQIADFLEGVRGCEDVRAYCRHWREWCRNNPSSVPKLRKN